MAAKGPSQCWLFVAFAKGLSEALVILILALEPPECSPPARTLSGLLPELLRLFDLLGGDCWTVYRFLTQHHPAQATRRIQVERDRRRQSELGSGGSGFILILWDLDFRRTGSVQIPISGICPPGRTRCFEMIQSTSSGRVIHLSILRRRIDLA